MYAHVSTAFLHRVLSIIILPSIWISIKLMQCVSFLLCRWKLTSSCLATPMKILTSFSVGLLGTLQRTTSGYWLLYLWPNETLINITVRPLLRKTFFSLIFAYMIIATNVHNIAFLCCLLYWDLFAIFVPLPVVYEKVLITENLSSFILVIEVFTTLWYIFKF